MKAVFELKEAQTLPEGTTITLLLENQAGAPGHSIGRFRLSSSDLKADSPILQPVSAELEASLRLPAAERTAVQKQALLLAILKLENQPRLPNCRLLNWSMQ
jgi:hypothetical protein